MSCQAVQSKRVVIGKIVSNCARLSAVISAETQGTGMYVLTRILTWAGTWAIEPNAVSAALLVTPVARIIFLQLALRPTTTLAEGVVPCATEHAA